MDNLLNQNQVETTKKSKNVEQPQTNSTVNLTVEDIAKTILLLQQQNQQETAYQKQLEEIERKNRTISMSGKASHSFRQKMVQELKDGKYFAYPYVPALAEKFGAFFQMQISGYTLYFNKGLTTKVPLSLLPHVNARFNQGSGLGNVMAPVVDERGAIDATASRELSNQIESILPNPKRQRY